MPKADTLRKLIQRKRHAVRAAPPAPADLQNLVIPDDYKQYESAPGQFEQFLLADTGAGPNRILIFGRDGNMTWCDEVQAFYMDGTFKQSPPLFHQVYVILAERNGHVVPLLYTLLPNKRRQTNTSCCFAPSPNDGHSYSRSLSRWTSRLRRFRRCRRLFQTHSCSAACST